MINYLLLTADKKSRLVYTLMSENISTLRVIFYLMSAAILFNLSLQSELVTTSYGTDFLKIFMFFSVGIIAATIANSTGAGGGIVFLPIFMGLGFSPAESLSTSFAIQCFGMSSGALTWINYSIKEQHKYFLQWNSFYMILLIGAFGSCAGVLTTQYWMPQPPINIELLFSLFSLVIGALILFRTLKIKKEYSGRKHNLTPPESCGLVVISFIGGAITTWLSIGVGELLLIYLILLGFRLNVAVASAVCVTALCVLTALPNHIASSTINFDVLIFSAPGALVGGVIARSLATYLGAHKLKIAASTWIIISAIPYFIISI